MTPAEARLHPLLVLLACLAALGAALVAQYGFGLRPCHLCLLQRVPYGLAALFAAMAVATPEEERLRMLLLAVCAMLFAANAGIAAFHVGVERHWWESSCSGTGALAGSAADLMARLKAGPVTPACDSVGWTLFGVTMAGYNLVGSLVLAGFSTWAARRAAGGKTGDNPGDTP